MSGIKVVVVVVVVAVAVAVAVVVVVVVVVVQCQSTRQLISCFIIAGSDVLGDCYRGDFTAREFNDQARRL